jgi:hypothetical protein
MKSCPSFRSPHAVSHHLSLHDLSDISEPIPCSAPLFRHAVHIHSTKLAFVSFRSLISSPSLQMCVCVCVPHLKYNLTVERKVELCVFYLCLLG